MESITSIEFVYSVPHFIGGVSSGLGVWIVIVLSSKTVTAIKTFLS